MNYKYIKSNFDMSPQDQMNLHHNAGAVATATIKEIVIEAVKAGSVNTESFEALSKDMVKAIKVLRAEIADTPKQPKVLS